MEAAKPSIPTTYLTDCWSRAAYDIRTPAGILDTALRAGGLVGRYRTLPR